MPNRQPNVVARRALAAATSALILAGAIMPAATAAAGAPPVLRTDYINTLKNVATTGNVLANDKDPAGGSVIFESFVPVSSTIGTLTIAANGGYTFTQGRQRLTGKAALAFVRQRKNRPRGDLDRVVNQQRLLAAVADQVVSRKVATDPTTMTAVVAAITGSVTVDDTLSPQALTGMLTSLVSLRRDQVLYGTVPFGGFGTQGGQSVVYLDSTRSAKLWAQLSTPDLRTVTLSPRG